MPYSKKEDLPSSVKNSLPSEAQRVYMEVFNRSYNSCKSKGGGDCDKVASTSAWVAVKNGWEKNKYGKWVKKK
jgi:cation transport regulator ChaB